VKNDTIASIARLRCRRESGSFSAAAQKLDLVPRSSRARHAAGADRGHDAVSPVDRKVVLSADGEHIWSGIIAAIAAHDQPDELRKAYGD